MTDPYTSSPFIAPTASVLSQRVAQTAALLLVILSLVFLTAWILRISSLLQILPGQTAIVLSTALCFGSIGITLLISFRAPHIGRALPTTVGSLVIMIAGLMLLQHLTRTDFGIDWRSFHAWLTDVNQYPGRMAPNTSVAFLLAGTTIILMPRVQSRTTLHAIEMLSFIIILIGLLSAAGYALKLEFLYGWYRATHMALPTAIGVIILGIALWATWHQLPKAIRMLQLHPHNRIIWIGGSTFFMIALMAGLGGFASMQHRTEATLENGLMRTLQNRSDLFTVVLDNASDDARLIATRPALYRHLEKLNANPDNAAERALLTRAAKSFLPLGFSAIAFYDKQGRELVRAGAFAHSPDLAVTLSLPFAAKLLWQTGFLLEARLPMRDGDQNLGSVFVQVPLPKLTQMLQDVRLLGETGEMGICAPEGKQMMACFPVRLHPKVFRLPYKMDGQWLPMGHALEGRSGLLNTLDYRRRDVTAAYAPIGQFGLGIVVKIDTAELYKPIREQLRWAIPLLLGLIGLGVWVLHALVTPLVRRLATSEEKYRAVAETAHDAMVTANVHGEIVYWNRAAESIFGYSESEILGQPLSQLMPERYRVAHQQGWDRLQNTNQPRLLWTTVELQGLHKGGEEFPLELSLSRWYNRGEQFFTGVMRDISRRKKAEHAARHLANIVESSSDAIFSKNLGDIVTSWNAAAERLYGYPAAEMLDQSGRLLLPPDKLTEGQDFIERLQRGASIEQYKTVRLRKDGTRVDVTLTVSLLVDASGKVDGTSVIARATTPAPH